MSDIVETNVNNPINNVDPSKSSNNAQEQEVNDLSEFLKLEHNKYLQYKIIYDTLEDFVNENSPVEKSLKCKVKDIIYGGSITQVVQLDENVLDADNGSLFGLPRLDDVELNYTESIQLQEVLKFKLDQKLKDINNGFRTVSNRDVKMLEDVKETVPIQLTSEDKVLMDYKNKFIFEQKQYVKNLLNLLELLKEIANLRLKELPQVVEQKLKECQVQEKMNHLKSLLAQEKVRVDMFMETSNSLKAYKELIKDIKEQQHEFRKEIQNLHALKEKYNHVSCKQYDDILKSYLQYKATIEKKKLLYDCLKS